MEKYARLPSSEDGDSEAQPQSHGESLLRYAVVLFVIASTLALGYALGYHFASAGAAGDGNPFRISSRIRKPHGKIN
jgi:hypothetical protein